MISNYWPYHIHLMDYSHHIGRELVYEIFRGHDHKIVIYLTAGYIRTIPHCPNDRRFI